MEQTERIRLILSSDTKKAVSDLQHFSNQAGAAGKQMEDEFEKSTSKIGGTFSKLGGMASQFGIPFSGVLDNIGKKFDEAKSHGSGLKDQISAIGGTVATAGAAGLVAVGAESIHLADSYDEAHRRLETAVTGSGENMDEWKGKIASASSSMANLGYTSTDVEGALTSGVVATQSVGKSLSLMTTAADLAAYKHISLGEAMTAVARASEGQTKALKSLGIDLPVAAGGALKTKNAQDALTKTQKASAAYLAQYGDAINVNSKHHAAYEKMLGATKAAQQKLSDTQDAGKQIIDGLSKRIGGQAVSATKGLHGETRVLQAKLSDIGITIGQHLLPILESLIGGVSSLCRWFSRHQAAAIALAGVIGGVLSIAVGVFVVNKVKGFIDGIKNAGKALSGMKDLILKAIPGFGEYAAAQDTAAVSTEGMGAAGDAAAPGVLAVSWPILAIVAAIALLVLGIYELWKHWKTVFGFVKAVVKTVVEFVKQHFMMLLAIFAAPVFLALVVWKHFHGAITGFIKDIVKFIKGHWKLLVEILLGPIGWAIAAWKKWGKDLTKIFDGVLKAIKQVWNDVIDGFKWAWNEVKKGADWLNDNVLHPLVKFFEAIPKGISSAFTTLKDVITTPFKEAFKFIAKIWNETLGGFHISIPSWVPVVGGDSITLPKMSVPHLAEGGVVKARPGGTLALLGEAKQDEAVIPLNRAGHSLGGSNITVNAITNADPRQIANQIGWILRTQGAH